jgi:hypothetical protein
MTAIGLRDDAIGAHPAGDAKTMRRNAMRRACRTDGTGASFLPYC